MEGEEKGRKGLNGKNEEPGMKGQRQTDQGLLHARLCYRYGETH